MKKLLGILAALGLTATASTAVVSCGDEMIHWNPSETDKKAGNSPSATITIGWEQSFIRVTVNHVPDSNISPDDITILNGSGDNAKQMNFEISSVARASNYIIINTNWNADDLRKAGFQANHKYWVKIKGFIDGGMNYFTMIFPN